MGKNIYLFTLTIAKRYVKYRAALLGRPILEFAFDQWPFVGRGKRVWRSPLQIYPAIPGEAIDFLQARLHSQQPPAMMQIETAKQFV